VHGSSINNVEFYSKKKFEKLGNLVGFVIKTVINLRVLLKAGILYYPSWKIICPSRTLLHEIMYESASNTGWITWLY